MEHSDRRPSYLIAILIAILCWHACKLGQSQTGARPMEGCGGAAPNPARAKERPSTAARHPTAFQTQLAEAAAFDPDPAAAIDRFMVQYLRVRMAETQQPPPLSRIMLARGRRFTSSTHPE
jgi:hypothetical protein